MKKLIFLFIYTILVVKIEQYYIAHWVVGDDRNMFLVEDMFKK